MKFINTLSILVSVSLVSGRKLICKNAKCCSGCDVITEQGNTYWGFEKGKWCEIKPDCIKEEKECFSEPFHPCCEGCNVVGETEEGLWGIENNKWCGIKESCENLPDMPNDDEDSEDSNIEENVRVVEDGVILPNDEYLYQVGRWDSDNVSQWAGTGFKLDFTGTSFTFVSGEKSQPFITVAYSLDYTEFQVKNVTIGENVLASKMENTDHNIQFYVTNTDGGYLQMDSLMIDAGAKIHKYELLDHYVQVIGDSLSTGQYSPQEAFNSWDFLLGQKLNVELDIVAQPGTCLTDMECWGNPNGMSFQYFMTDNPMSGVWGYSDDVPYDFSKKREPEVIIFFMGTNDKSVPTPVTKEEFLENVKKFFTKIREIYPDTTIVMSSLAYNDEEWNNYASTIVGYFENIYYFRINEYIVDGVPNIYPTNGHLTQIGNCRLMEGYAKDLKEIVGFSGQEKQTDRWGMHGNVATGIEVCNNPLDESVVYHYKWNDAGGVGAW